MSETSEVTSPTIAALNGIPGVFAYRMHSGRVKRAGGWQFLGQDGMPDVGCVVGGKALFFECKAPKGLVSEAQLVQHGKLRRAGADVHVIRSARQAVDIVRELLEASEVARGRKVAG